MTDASSSTKNLLRELLYGFTNFGLFLSGIVNLSVGTWFAWHADSTMAATSLTAALVLLFAATIDRFESLKGLGIEAKTRKLDEKIEQADDALRKLRQLTELTGSALVNINSKIGRWDSAPTPRESLLLAEQVRSIMQRLGSETTVIVSVLRPWAFMLCCDLTNYYVHAIREIVTKKINELSTHHLSLPQPLVADNPELARVNEEKKVYNDYLKNLCDPYQYQLEDFPVCFMSLFDKVPEGIRVELATLYEKAARYENEMIILNKTALLQHPELWIGDLDEARRKQI